MSQSCLKMVSECVYGSVGNGTDRTFPNFEVKVRCLHRARSGCTWGWVIFFGFPH